MVFTSQPKITAYFTGAGPQINKPIIDVIQTCREPSLDRISPRDLTELWGSQGGGGANEGVGEVLIKTTQSDGSPVEGGKSIADEEVTSLPEAGLNQASGTLNFKSTTEGL